MKSKKPKARNRRSKAAREREERAVYAKASAWLERDLILRLLALPMRERMNFIRVPFGPWGGSTL